MSRERRAHFRVRYGGEREEGGGEVEQERAKERGRGGEGRETLIITKRNEVTKRNEQCPRKRLHSRAFFASSSNREMSFIIQNVKNRARIVLEFGKRKKKTAAAKAPLEFRI